MWPPNPVGPGRLGDIEHNYIAEVGSRWTCPRVAKDNSKDNSKLILFGILQDPHAISVFKLTGKILKFLSIFGVFLSIWIILSSRYVTAQPH